MVVMNVIMTSKYEADWIYAIVARHTTQLAQNGQFPRMLFIALFHLHTFLCSLVVFLGFLFFLRRGLSIAYK